jgi:hypothetical protein
MAGPTRKIEIFSAGCPKCEDAIRRVKEAACPSCDIEVLNMMLPEVQRRATELGVLSLPAVTIDGKLAGCCAGRSVDIDILKAAGLGRPLA